MELNSQIRKLNPFRRYDSIKHLVALCQRRMHTLQSLRNSASRHRNLDNSAIEALHQRLKKERLLAGHQARIAAIMAQGAVP